MADANEQAAADAAKAKADAVAKIDELKKAGVKVYSDEEMQEAITRRQEALDKLRVKEEAEKKATDAATKAAEEDAKKKGEWKTLLEQKEQEVLKLLEEKKTLSEKAQKADEAEKALREQTLAKISDPDLKKMAGELSTTSLMAFAEKVTTGKITPIAGQQKGNERPSFKNADEMQAYLRANNL